MYSDPRNFLYRDGFDPDAAATLTAEALRGAEDGELYLQYRKTEAFGFDDGRLKTASFDTQSGFGLRAVSGRPRRSPMPTRSRPRRFAAPPRRWR